VEESIEPGDEATPEMGVSRFDLNINAVGWCIEEKRFINPLGGLQSILDPDRAEPMELLTEKIKPGNAGRLSSAVASAIRGRFCCRRWKSIGTTRRHEHRDAACQVWSCGST